jgi:hypothetical protein
MFQIIVITLESKDYSTPPSGPELRPGKQLSAAGGCAPAFLRRTDQDINATGLHVYPQFSGGDAIEYKQAAHQMNGVHDCADVGFRQQQAGRK